MRPSKKDKLNILFIMTDQQRFDYLSIYGNRALQTPAMDWVGQEGTAFTNAYVQFAVSGPSRACFYTGRYVHANGVKFNEVPLHLTERTAGHYFSEAGYRAGVLGKTHTFSEYPKPDFVKKSCKSASRKHLSYMDSVGFEYITGAAWSPAVPNHQYLKYLREKGYEGKGNQLVDKAYYGYAPEEGKKYAHPLRQPAVLKAEDSEGHYLTDRAIQFIRETKGRPWFLHLSFFRPHHPNIASAPYNEMYSEGDFPEPVRSEEELRHPLFKEFRAERNAHMGPAEDIDFCRHWRAVYAGLIKELDDNLVRLFDFMKKEHLLDNTVIIFTSDHGEFAGDHWFFEKGMFHKQSHHIPLLIRCPGLPKGITASQFVESVDVLPTCLEAAGLEIPPAIQGRSLMPLMAGKQPAGWRRETFAEWSFEYYNAPVKMGMREEDCRAVMIRNEQYNYCHFNGLPDVLFDLKKDPDELHNVAEEAAYQKIVHELKTKLLDWQLRTWDPLPLRIDRDWPRRRGIGPKPEEVPYNLGG